VVSLCQSSEWRSLVEPRVAAFVDADWFSRLDARVADILSADYSAIIEGHSRVLLFWDAHGFEIAEVVLGDILPRLAEREHLVLMHDISDNRYGGVSRSYAGQPLWKGIKWQQRTGSWGSRVNIGWMNSIQDQVIAIADFSARNDLEVGSADDAYAKFFAAHAGCAEEMRQVVGDDFFSTVGQWAFVSLTGKAGPFHFPAVTVSGRQSFSHRSAVVVDELRRLPATVETEPRAWAYASTLTWRPTGDVPGDARPWLQFRVRVERGTVGVSLLSRDENEFVESKVVACASEPVEVRLRIDNLSQRGRVVIHTWDSPIAAHVRIEDVSLVW
jgi:hypothetical protein